VLSIRSDAILNPRIVHGMILPLFTRATRLVAIKENYPGWKLLAPLDIHGGEDRTDFDYRRADKYARINVTMRQNGISIGFLEYIR